MLRKLKNFIIALCKHIAFGMQKSSLQEIQYRFDICNQCSSIHPNKNQCLECGCYISNKKIFLNKLAWKDQKCPLNKW